MPVIIYYLAKLQSCNILIVKTKNHGHILTLSKLYSILVLVLLLRQNILLLLILSHNLYYIILIC